jgi:hypothetical protein
VKIAPGSAPCVASSSAALSRTLRVRAWLTATPKNRSLICGPGGVRLRLGLRPNRPLSAAGWRMDPPPSVACAIGTMPEATAAAAPPLDPPADSRESRGLTVAPWARVSVVKLSPSSAELVLPKMTRPAAL